MLLGNVNTAVAKSSAHCVTVSVYTCMNLSPFLLRRSMSTSTVSSYDGERRKPKGAVLFTGPDGNGDFKVRVEEQHFIGHGSTSPEASGDTNYLYRAAPDCPHPPPKTARVGEVGWGVPKLSDQTLLKSGHQIMLKEFRQAAEDQHTHLYQTPYYPPPEAKPKTPPTNTVAQQEKACAELVSPSQQSTHSETSNQAQNVHTD